MNWAFSRLFGPSRHSKSFRRRSPRRVARLEALGPRRLLAIAAPLAGDSAGPVEDIASASWDPPIPAAIVNGTLTSEFPSVGIVNNSCTGTLISPRHVLTAAHCTEDVRETRGLFELDSGLTVRASQQIEHPQYNSFSLANDIAIMILAQAVDSVTPSPILRARPVVGEMLTLVGYGDGGRTFVPIRDFPTKRVGQTELETISNNQLRWTFNGNGESNTATGDSGGPAFVDRNGELVVAGITSGGDGDPWNRGGDIDHAWDTRVDVYANWIDAIVSGQTPPSEADEHINDAALGATKVAIIGGHGWESGKLQHAGDRDAFRFRLGSQARTSVTVTSIDGTLDTYLRLYDVDGQLVQANDDLVSGGNTNSRIIRTLQSGTYFFTVGAFDDGAVGEYSVTVDLGDEPSGDQHANTPGSSATDLKVDADGHAAISGRLESATDRDFFEFVLDESTPVTLAAVATDGNLDTYLRLYDSEGTQIDFNDDGPVTTDSLIETELEPGTFFASVASFNSRAGTYVLSLQVTPELVDMFIDPAKITLDRFGRALLADSVDEPGGFTTFTFVSQFTGNMTAVTRAVDASTDTRIVVYDSSKTELAAANDRTLANLNSIVEFDVRENERYFVVVEGEAGTTGDYWLTLRTSFSAKEKAFSSLGNGSSTRRSAQPTKPATPAGVLPMAAAKPPQLLPIEKTPVKLSVDAARDVLFAKWLAVRDRL